MRAIETGGLGMVEQCLDLDLSLLDLCPEFIIDDTQMREVGNNPVALIVHPGFALLRFRILAERSAIEDEAANICFVVENADTAIPGTPDGGIPPLQSAWTRDRWNATVQLDSHGLRGAAQHELLENPADDLGLLIVDLA